MFNKLFLKMRGKMGCPEAMHLSRRCLVSSLQGQFADFVPRAMFTFDHHPHWFVGLEYCRIAAVTCRDSTTACNSCRISCRNSCSQPCVFCLCGFRSYVQRKGENRAKNEGPENQHVLLDFNVGEAVKLKRT